MAHRKKLTRVHNAQLQTKKLHCLIAFWCTQSTSSLDLFELSVKASQFLYSIQSA